jgi:hypothetical protein
VVVFQISELDAENKLEEDDEDEDAEVCQAIDYISRGEQKNNSLVVGVLILRRLFPFPLLPFSLWPRLARCFQQTPEQNEVASRRATRGNSAAIRPDDLISLDEWGVD